MIHYTSECELCDRVIPADEAEDQRCDGCGAVICDDHSGEPLGMHPPEDHISAEDAEGVEEPYPFGA
jgi:hypothetical protein